MVMSSALRAKRDDTNASCRKCLLAFNDFIISLNGAIVMSTRHNNAAPLADNTFNDNHYFIEIVQW